jgi:hypothetical protein
MHNKGLYILIGILIGIIIVLVLAKLPIQPLYAVDPANSADGASDGFIALTTNTIKTQATILWLVDVKKSNLLLYEFAGDSTIKLKAFRDISFDLDVPNGYFGFQMSKGDSPLEIRQGYKAREKELQKQIDELLKSEKSEK